MVGGRRAGLIASVWMVFVLLVAVFGVVLNVPVVKGNLVYIYIRADGSVEGTDKIVTADNITYTFTEDIFVPIDYNLLQPYDGIVVERSNIIIDGNGYTLYGKPGAVGFILYAGGVTIRNTNIRDCDWGIHVLSSSNTISGNNITSNSGAGIIFFLSDSILRNNVVAENNITAGGGIACMWLHDSNITGNNITTKITTNSGISLDFSDGNSISGNYIVAANNGNGITFYDWSSNNIISRNNITANNGAGVWLGSCPNNNISENDFFGCGLWASGSVGNVVKDNVVNGKPLVYLEGVSNCTVDNAGQVILVDCDNITVENLNLSYATVGAVLSGTRNSKITNNTISNNNYCGVYLGYDWTVPFSGNNSICANNIANNYYGIQLDYLSTNNSIVRNNITNSGKYGILFYSGNNTASENNIVNNSCGIYLGYGAPSNNIFHNNFVNNTIQANSNEFNTWDGGYPSGGNYWSDYTGADEKSGSDQDQSGSDGVGDTPYIIDANNQDRYPLMKPYPWSSHDIGISAFKISKTIIGQGCSIPININVFNYGNNTENFNIYLYANTTFLFGLPTMPIVSRNSFIVIFNWDTTSYAYGNYTITATITTVPGETVTADNTRTCTVKITIPGDYNGDYTVNDLDADQIRQYWLQTQPAAPPSLDINDDGIVNIIDATPIGWNWLKHA